MLKSPSWKPGPSYISRLITTKQWLPSHGKGLHLLEVGCGESGFACWAAMRGFSVTALDICEHSCMVQKQRSMELGLSLEVLCQKNIPENQAYDIICAFELIEHIEDDIQTLKAFRRSLKKGGILILSVPAHMKKWSKFDVLCGHVRRYERNELLKKLMYSGFDSIKIVSRGFPSVNIVRKFDILLRRKDSIEGNAITRSQKSGKQSFRKLSFLLQPLATILYPMIAAQRFFYDTDLGRGYSVKAVAT